LARDVLPANISGDAVIRGNTLLEGAGTSVAADAIVEDSYCKDVTIESNATVRDSTIVSTGQSQMRKCDAAGKYLTGGGQSQVSAGAAIVSSHLEDTIVLSGALVEGTVALNCTIGTNSKVSTAKMKAVHTEANVTIKGPTEISGAWLGSKTYIDQPGYFKGVFSNEFFVLGFDGESGELFVKEVIDIPHVSRYGTNVICSSNSGRLLPQPQGKLKELGAHVGLWHQSLLSHEPVLFGPCCWVCPWTKVVGGTSLAYGDAAEMISDALDTYLMPFSVCGYGADGVTGQVPPGEKGNGYGHKQRTGGWVFTYCPDAIIEMVQRLYDALTDDEKHKADIVAELSLRNALCLLQYRARQLNTDLSQPREKQRGSRGKWFWDYKNVLEAHINSGIWKFKDGKPVGWSCKKGKWQNEKLHRIRQQAASANEDADITENDLLAEPEFRVYPENALAAEDLAQTGSGEGAVHRDAVIHETAIIDQTAGVGAQVRVGEKAYIGPGTVLQGNTSIGKRAWLFRCIVDNAEVGEGTWLSRCLVKGTKERVCSIGAGAELIGCKIISSGIGDSSTGVEAKVTNSTLAAETTLNMFAAVDNVQTTEATIIGTAMKDCRIDTILMSMHSPGNVTGMTAVPVTVTIDGREVKIPAIPMLGGGCQIRGKGDGADAVVLEGAFIASNAVIEAGTFVGFSSFVQGRLGPDEGLLPFTVSTQQGPQTDEIGAVLTRFSNMVVTHTICWTYQALPKDRAGDVVHLITGAIKYGIDAIESELQRRKSKEPLSAASKFARYKSLPLYSEQQLEDGLATYREALEQKSWEMTFDGTNLSFTNETGFWLEKNGRICWQKSCQSRS